MAVNGSVQFGPFELDLDVPELRSGGQRVSIQDLPLRLLAALVRRPGQLVRYAELRSLLWGGTVVDFEAGLHTAARKLRQALGDSAADPQFLETIPKRGFRFIAPLTPSVQPQADLAAPTQIPSAAKTYLVPGIIGIAAAALVLTGAWLASPPTSANSSTNAIFSPIPLVSERGIVRSPTLSPDGSQVAFSWAPEGAECLGLYVQNVDGAGRRKLTANAESDRFPAWSPDGRRIAFFRNGEILLIPAGGGLETKLTTGIATSLSWSPDSRRIALADRLPSGSTAILLVDVDSGERRNISTPENASQHDLWPAFSPDGTRVAFVRNTLVGPEVYIAPLEGDPLERVVRALESGRGLTGLAWSPAGDHLILGGGRLGMFSVAVTARDATDHDLVRIDAAGEDVQTPSMIRNPVTGHLDLAYGRERDDTDIVASSLVNGLLAPVPIQASNRQDGAPSVSADGRKLAFLSKRSGSPEIWTSNVDGSQARRLTHFASGQMGTPKWSPDAESVVFDVKVERNRDIYVVGSEGTPVLRLTTENAADWLPSWSHDGKWIYFTSDRSGRRQIWKMSSTGQNPVQLTQQEGEGALEAPDGKNVYYVKRHHGVWKIPAGGGAEERVVEGAWLNYWAVADDGIYYFDLGDLTPEAFEFQRHCVLRKFEFATGRTVELAVLQTTLAPWDSSFAIRRDGGWLAWGVQPDRTSDLLLIRNLQVPAP